MVKSESLSSDILVTLKVILISEVRNTVKLEIVIH